MAEKKSRGFPFDFCRAKCTMIAYANKQFNVHSEYSLMSAGAEAQECKTSSDSSSENVAEYEEYYKATSNKKTFAKSIHLLNLPTVNVKDNANIAEAMSALAEKAKSAPAIKNRPEMEEESHVLLRRRKRINNMKKMARKKMMGYVRMCGYGIGCYVGVGVVYLCMLEVPVLGPCLEYCGVGRARPLFFPISYVCKAVVGSRREIQEGEVQSESCVSTGWALLDAWLYDSETTYSEDA